MDLGLLVNTAFVGGIIAILQTIKLMDTQGKLASGFYVIGALVLGFLGGFIITPYVAPFVQWMQKAAVSGVTYAGAASILFQTGKLVLVKREDGSAKVINKATPIVEDKAPDVPDAGK